MTGTDRNGGVAPTPCETWRRLVAPETGDIAHLRSVTLDGVPIEPLYPPASGAGPLPMRGGKPWTIVETLDHASPEAAHEAAATALADGAGGLALRFRSAPDEPGLPVAAESLDACLAGLDLDGISVRLEPSPQSAEIAGWLAERMAADSALAAADMSFGLNPVAQSVRRRPRDPPGPFAAAWQNIAAARPLALIAEIDGRPYHAAGAGEALELAGILAEAADVLRAVEAVGVAPATAIDGIGASLAVDHDQLLSIAKLRALRLLIARLREIIGAPPKPLRIHAETSLRALTARDPHNNLVRATIAAFAAGVGGADSISVVPFDAALRDASDPARRLARNTQHLLIHEAHIYRVADPAAGSGAAEALTEALCERAWEIFRSIEADDGVLESLAGGVLASGLAEGRAALAEAVAGGEKALVGVTVYPAEASPTESRPAAAPIHPALAPMRLEAAP